MSKIFLEILNNSIIAGYLIIAVMIARLILKKAPKWSVCLLWAMVGIRLVMPFKVESSYSLIPDFNLIKTESGKTSYDMDELQKEIIYKKYFQNVQNMQTENSKRNVGKENVMETDNGNEESYQLTLGDRNSLSKLLVIVTYIWMVGVLGLAAYAGLSFLKLKRKIAVSIPLYDNVYLCDEIESPFVMGSFKPCIYLPSKTPKEIWDFILKHEKAHIKRADHVWKLLGYFLLVVYWFHPLSWAAYILFCKDMELACDEKVTKEMDKRQRTEYCEALLVCSVNRKKMDVCPVAFGEVGVRERIKQILNYKKPSFWVILLAFAVCIVVSVCFLTSPKSKTEDAAFSETTEMISAMNSEVNGQQNTEDITEYDHIKPNEAGYRWLSDEVYVYEYEDLDQNGVEEYSKVYQSSKEEEYICNLTFCWNGEAVYEYKSSSGISPGNAEYLDLDDDGQKELFLTFWPHVNSMPLIEYIVLKQNADMAWEPLEMIHGEEIWQNAFPISVTKGKNEREAVIKCEGLEKTVIFDIGFYHGKLLELRDNAEPGEKDYWLNLINDYKYGFPETSEWYTFGSVCAWGIWDIQSGEYQGRPCLIATHGIQGYDKFDFWGELDVYFDYDTKGKTRFLDMQFRNSETWAGAVQQRKEEFTMEDLITLCDAGSEVLKNAMTDFSSEGELPYSNFEKSISKTSLTWDYFCDLSYEGKEYRMQLSYWKPEEAEAYGHLGNELEGIYLYYPETKDTRLLYAAEERFTADLNIRSFLDKEYSLMPCVEFDLPDTLKLGEFRSDLTIAREGCLFEGNYEEQSHGDFTPEDWYVPGGIKFVEKQYFGSNLRFDHGKLKEVKVLQNHSDIISDFEFIEGCDMQAVLCEFCFDLFTAAEVEEYMQEHGVTYEEFTWNSKYWYVFFAEEDSKYVYILFLNQEYFGKEDMIELARSMKFRVK